MLAIYINNGSIKPRLEQKHWPVPSLLGEIVECVEIDEANATFECIPIKEELKYSEFTVDKVNRIYCNREELRIL